WVEIDLLHLGVGTHHGMNSGENGSSASNDQQAMGRWGLWSGYIEFQLPADSIEKNRHDSAP
ncbi:hypothetical protein, partial [Pseudomonas aeruginosa]|uniref:hypothetical protein n=1 Tax=Pseudomonas aeruginosa TaxID=287 RepID=UPI001C6974FE